jgi:hypothetical protein
LTFNTNFTRQNQALTPNTSSTGQSQAMTLNTNFTQKNQALTLNTNLTRQNQAVDKQRFSRALNGLENGLERYWLDSISHTVTSAT